MMEAEKQKSRKAEWDDGDECAMILDRVSHFSALKDNYFNAIVVAAMDNYELRITNYETLRFLFNYRGQYGDYLSIVETYLAENNYNEALATLAQMVEKFKLSEEQRAEINGLEIYTHWLQQLNNEQNSIYTLTENEIEYLVNFTETNTGRGAVFAKNILCGLYGICLDEVRGVGYWVSGMGYEVSGDENLRESVASVYFGRLNNTSVCKKALENIKIYPNPGKDYITVVCEVENCLFELINLIGSVQKSVRLQQGNNIINTSSLKQGFYIYRVVRNDNVVTGKWLKTPSCKN